MTLSFNTYFNLNTGQVSIQDTSAYSYPGDINNPYIGILTIVGPKGLVYSNNNLATPDVILATSTYSKNINLPVDKYGFVLQGTYAITYTSAPGINTGTSSQANTYNYDFTIPAYDIELIPNGYASTFTANDNTDYYSPLSIARTFTVTPSQGSPQTTSGTQIVYSPNIWSGWWSCTLSSALTYNIGGINVSVTITGQAKVYVYSVDMSAIESYIEQFRLNYITELNINKALANSMNVTLGLINTCYTQYQMALQNSNLLEAYNQAVNIINLLNDYVPSGIEEITPYEP